MEDYSLYTDEQLIRCLREGNDHIMDYLLKKYKPLVRKKANALYLIGGETEDLIQEGMIGLFKAIRDYKEDKDSGFYNFAQLCIARQLYSALEASNRKKHIPLNTYVSFSQDETKTYNLEDCLTQDLLSPEQIFIEQEKFDEFKEHLLGQLSKMEKNVLSLYLDGNDYIQIAQIMDKTPKSIDNALQRIRQKLKRK